MKYLVILSLASLLMSEAAAANPLLYTGTQDHSLFTPTKRSIPHTHTRHERRTEAQGRLWNRVGRAKREALLPMRIGLKQSNLRSGHDLLTDISNPESENYGKHLSAEEVIDLFAPVKETMQAVKSWLVDAGIPSHAISQSTNKQWVQFDAPVEKVEEILMADYHIFEHKDTGVQDIGCDEYHVPRTVKQHIDYITPGIKLMGYGSTQAPASSLRRRDDRDTKKRDMPSYPRIIEPVEKKDLARVMSSRSRQQSDVPLADVASGNLTLPGGCELYVTPDCIRSLYGIPKGTKKHPDNKMGIFQSLGQHYTQFDLDSFFWSFTDDIPNGTHPELYSVNGGEGPTTSLRNAGTESNLDFQMAYGLIWPQDTVLFQVDDEWYQQAMMTAPLEYTGFFNNLWNAIDGSYCTFEAFGEAGNCRRPECRDPEYPNPNDEGGFAGELMCGVYRPTNVISISYSGAEIDLPESYQQRQCAEIMKLGLQGSTVLIASGDDGVASFATSNHPTGCLGPRQDVFNPQFLASCPYILAVGATVLNDGTAGVDPEAATDRFGSGGGFSNIYDAPAWQAASVARFLDVADLPFEGYEGGGGNFSNAREGLGRFNRRGRAYPDVAANGDHFVISSGGELLRIGGTSASCPLWGAVITLINEERLEAGKAPVGFVHPVLYSHPEVFKDITAGDNRGCQTNGFPAVEGWDPVTGLGTPDYPKLLELFMSLP
ncbi:putative alkaline serine protease AorO [Xylariomycetidae sp. FL2044]|nr:putative alkaline serine protease AorO [Xylariomycetidae sp. FL2044]